MSKNEPIGLDPAKTKRLLEECRDMLYEVCTTPVSLDVDFLKAKRVMDKVNKFLASAESLDWLFIQTTGQQRRLLRLANYLRGAEENARALAAYLEQVRVEMQTEREVGK